MRFITLNCFVGEKADALEKISINTHHIISWRMITKEITGVLVEGGLEYTARHSKYEVTAMIKSADATNPAWEQKPTVISKGSPVKETGLSAYFKDVDR